jgi:hypothetical protein
VCAIRTDQDRSGPIRTGASLRAANYCQDDTQASATLSNVQPPARFTTTAYPHSASGAPEWPAINYNSLIVQSIHRMMSHQVREVNAHCGLDM